MAETFSHVNGYNARPCGYQALAVSGAAVTLAAPGKTPANAALLQVETGQVRWRDDGTDPTASVGMLMSPGDPPFPFSGNLSALRFIRVSVDASVNASLYLIGLSGE